MMNTGGIPSRRHSIKRAFSHGSRIREVVSILLQHHLSDYVKLLRLDRSLKILRRITSGKDALPEGMYSRYELIRMAVEKLGTTYIKFGQLLSNRNDLLPQPLVDELAKLQDTVPPIPEAGIRRTLEREFGKPLEEVFPEFNIRPVASASIAQVHEARLPDGTRVAVKIQRPGIEKVIDVDLDILGGLAHLAEKYLKEARHFDLTGMVGEFRTKLKIELNFRRELLHIQKFENLFRGREEVIRIPRAHPEYSTRLILTMDYIEGIKVSQVKSQNRIACDEELLAGRIAELMMEQIFIHGFFHADPHPGNVLVLEDNVVCFLDFGMMGRIRPREQEALAVMLLGIVNRDAAKVTDSLLLLTRRTGRLNQEELEIRIYDLLEEYIDLSLEDFDITAMFTDLITLIRGFGLIIPSNILFMSKAIIAVEGIGRYLYPEFSLFRLFKPFSRKLIREQFRPEKVVTELYETGMKYKGFLEDLPADGGELLKQMKDGRFRIGFRLLGLDKLRRSLELTGLRFITGMSITGLVIGSSLLVSAGTPPLYRGLPVLALIGYGTAATLGIGTLISAIRRVFR